MSQNKAVIALDVGEKRIGVAVASGTVRIAVPLRAVEVDGSELENIAKVVSQEKADGIVLGYPRNQSGEATAQTAVVEEFSRRLAEVTQVRQSFQDESLTSVQAEEILSSYGKPYTKGEVDSQAAALILQDYLENNHEK